MGFAGASLLLAGLYCHPLPGRFFGLIGPFNGGIGPGLGLFGVTGDPLGFMAMPPAQASFFLPVSFQVFIGGFGFFAGQGVLFIRLFAGLGGSFVQGLSVLHVSFEFSVPLFLIIANLLPFQFSRAFFIIADDVLHTGTGRYRAVGQVDHAVIILIDGDFAGRKAAAAETDHSGDHDQAQDRVCPTRVSKLHGGDLHQDTKRSQPQSPAENPLGPSKGLCYRAGACMLSFVENECFVGNEEKKDPRLV